MAARGCAANFTYTYTNTAQYLLRRSSACIERVFYCNCPPSLFSSLFLLILPSASARLPQIAAPPPALRHGLTQHLQQRPKHHPQLPERRQLSAAVRRPSKLAHIRPMGCLCRSCPTSQRISERWRQRERIEGPKHRRYVQPTPGDSLPPLQRFRASARNALHYLEAVSDPLLG